jgi:hypothetical protein
MEILEAFDLTGSFRDAAELAGCSHHTVAAHVAAREAGRGSGVAATRPQLIDEYLAKIEEWVEHSAGKVRADKAHEKLLTLGYAGSERTTRRAVAAVRRDYRLGRVRVHRPWVTEPGMWLQYDFGDGPLIDGVRTTLFCAWLAWSRFRVVLAIRDKTMPSVFAALDVTLRRLGGAPTYVLTDNEKTVTVEHIAGMAVRNPQMVAFARHYGAVTRVAEGGSALDPQVVAALLNRKTPHDSLAQLTEREHEVLRLMAQGMTNTGIAKRLVLSLNPWSDPLAAADAVDGEVWTLGTWGVRWFAQRFHCGFLGVVPARRWSVSGRCWRRVWRRVCEVLVEDSVPDRQPPGGPGPVRRKVQYQASLGSGQPRWDVHDSAAQGGAARHRRLVRDERIGCAEQVVGDHRADRPRVVRREPG